MARWPAECPVFWDHWDREALVGVDIGQGFVHLLCNDGSVYDYPEGWDTGDFEPLTRAAREMLAIAMEGECNT
jgi:hypothetical protein